MTSEFGGGLPFPLAYMWGDFESFAQQAARDPGSGPLGLYHLLDAVEVSTRFLLAVTTAELDASGVVVKDPKNGWLGEVPAFGTWLRALEFTTKQLSAPVIVPRVGEAVVGLRALVEHEAFVHRDLEAKNLIGLRNWMAHGGVLSEAAARDILEAARPAIDEFLGVCTAVFAGVDLAYVGDDGSAAAIELEDGAPPPVGLSGQGPGLYVGRDGRWLQIWPLVRHAPAGRGEEAGRRLVTQVFVRLSAVAEYATLDPDSVAAFGRAESRAYRERFTDASVSRPFWAEIEEEAEGLIGRAEDLARVLACLENSRIEENPSPWWLSGPMGQGKSALAAALAIELRDRENHPVVAHFFRSGDQRCNLRSFVAQALDALDPEGEHPSDPKKALEQLKTLLLETSPMVICDGVDELTRSPTAAPGDLEKLFQLSGSGGAWLFTGRSDLDSVAKDQGLKKVFDPALPPMTALDLRGLVVSLAPQAVRDAILLRDRHDENGDLDNPYVSDLADRAQGLPLYVVLMLEWLASLGRPAEVKAHIAAALEDPEGTIPAGLSALYAKLVDGWGIGALSAKKTPLLCLLAAAAEPLDAESLAELCFAGPPRHPEDASRRVVICEEILTAFSPVLWSAPDQDGAWGWRLRHDSFRGYLADPDNAELRPVFDEASYTLATRGAEPEKSCHLPLTRHLYRHGIGYLRADGNDDRADELLGDFDYLYRRIQCLKVPGVEGVLVDYTGSREPMVMHWFRFMKNRAHLLRRTIPGWEPYQSLHQLACDASDTVISDAANEWCDHHDSPPLYRLAGQASESSAALVFEGHTGSVSGALELSDGRVLSWSNDSTLRLWDRATGLSMGSLQGHTQSVLGALELGDGVVVSWSADGTIRRWDSNGCGEIMSPLLASAEPIKLRNGRLLSWFGDAMQLWDLFDGSPLGSLIGHSEDISGALELCNGRILSWSDDLTLRLWEPENRTAIGPPLVGHTREVLGALELRNGHLLSWAADGTLRRWNPDTGAEILPALEGHAPPNEGAGGRSDASTILLNARNGVILGALELSSGLLLSWSADGTLRRWNAESGAEIEPPFEFNPYYAEVSGAVELRNGLVASWSERDIHADAPDGLGGFRRWNFSIWDPETGTEVADFRDCSTKVLGVRQLKDDDVLSWSLNDLHFWSPDTGIEVGRLNGYGEISETLELRDGGIISCSNDGTLRLWESGAPRDLPDELVSGAVELRDQRILTWSDANLHLWQHDNCAKVASLVGHSEPVSGALELRNGEVVSWSKDETIRVWDPTTGAARALLEGRGYLPDYQPIALKETDAVRTLVDGYVGDIEGALCLRNGRIAFWTYSDVTLWYPERGATRQLGDFRRSGPGVLELHGGRILSWARDPYELHVWDPDTGDAIGVLAGHSYWVHGAIELRSGRIVSWSEDGSLRVWDADTFAEIGDPLVGHAMPPAGALELSDGRLLSWSHDYTLRIWSPDTCAPLGKLESHIGPVIGAVELRNGLILSWSQFDQTGQTTRLWDPVSMTEVGRPDVDAATFTVSTMLDLEFCLNKEKTSLLTFADQLPNVQSAWSSLDGVSSVVLLGRSRTIVLFQNGRPIVIGGGFVSSKSAAT